MTCLLSWLSLSWIPLSLCALAKDLIWVVSEVFEIDNSSNNWTKSEEMPALLLNVFIFGVLGVVIYYIGHVLSDFTWYNFVSFSVFYGKKLITDKVYKIILIICSCLFFYFCFKFILIGSMNFFWNLDFSVYFPF